MFEDPSLVAYPPRNKRQRKIQFWLLSCSRVPYMVIRHTQSQPAPPHVLLTETSIILRQSFRVVLLVHALHVPPYAMPKTDMARNSYFALPVHVVNWNPSHELYLEV